MVVGRSTLQSDGLRWRGSVCQRMPSVLGRRAVPRHEFVVGGIQDKRWSCWQDRQCLKLVILPGTCWGFVSGLAVGCFPSVRTCRGGECGGVHADVCVLRKCCHVFACQCCRNLHGCARLRTAVPLLLCMWAAQRGALHANWHTCSAACKVLPVYIVPVYRQMFVPLNALSASPRGVAVTSMAGALSCC
jgi:hypothetical protein